MAYSWSEYRVYMGGRFITGIRGFKYKRAREVEGIYAEGDEVVDVGFGNKSNEGELSMLQNELEAIIESSPKHDPFRLPAITVVHSYIPFNGIGRIITDIWHGVYFKEIEKAMEQGKTFMEITTPVFITKIDYDVLNPFNT